MEKVKWWAEKIQLADLLSSLASGARRPDVHRTYAEMYKELRLSIFAIPHHIQNSSCRAFVARARLIPAMPQPKDLWELIPRPEIASLVKALSNPYFQRVYVSNWVETT